MVKKIVIGNTVEDSDWIMSQDKRECEQAIHDSLSGSKKKHSWLRVVVKKIKSQSLEG